MLSSENRRAGFGILDLLIAISLVTVILGVTFMLLQNSNSTWRKVTSSQGAASQLMQVESWLRRDLVQTAYSTTASGPSLSSLLGRDGDALWFLSAIDPVTGEFVRNEDGTPRWQRNILYYCVVPTGLSAFGFNGSGIEESGFEVSHPGKFLVRKVIDSGDVTTPTDPATQETLLADISSYLEVPNGTSLSAPDSESVTIVGRNLLSFRVERNDPMRRISVVLQAARLENRQLNFTVGSESLLKPGYLLERRLELYPENRTF